MKGAIIMNGTHASYAASSAAPMPSAATSEPRGAGTRQSPASGRAGGFLRHLSNELEFNPLSLVLALCDGLLAHDTLLIVSDSETLSLGLGAAIALVFFIVPQLMANSCYRTRKIAGALPLGGLYAVIGILLFAVRVQTGSASAAGAYRGEGASTAASLDTYMAGIMAFVMLVNAVVGFVFRTLSLRESDREAARELRGLLDRLVSKQRAMAGNRQLYRFDLEGYQKQVDREAEDKKRILLGLGAQHRRAIADYAVSLLADQEDARDLLKRLDEEERKLTQRPREAGSVRADHPTGSTMARAAAAGAACRWEADSYE